MKAEGWLEHRVAESAKDGVHVGVVVQRGVVADAGDGVPGAAAVGSAASQPDLDKVGLQEGGGEPRRCWKCLSVCGIETDGSEPWPFRTLLSGFVAHFSSFAAFVSFRSDDSFLTGYPASRCSVAGMPRSSFAPSPYSQRPNSASFGFGTATREQAAKVFINQELSLGKQFGVGSPGPAYGVSLPKAVGVQPDGRKGAPARILLALLQLDSFRCAPAYSLPLCVVSCARASRARATREPKPGTLFTISSPYPTSVSSQSYLNACSRRTRLGVLTRSTIPKEPFRERP